MPAMPRTFKAQKIAEKILGVPPNAQTKVAKNVRKKIQERVFQDNQTFSK